jgi:hypothetical protein
MQSHREFPDRRPTRWLRSLRRLGATVLALAMIAVASASPTLADDYDEKSSGHPLRIIAYVLHPVGVAIDYLLLRPAHWLGSREPLKTIFGHED